MTPIRHHHTEHTGTCCCEHAPKARHGACETGCVHETAAAHPETGNDDGVDSPADSPARKRDFIIPERGCACCEQGEDLAACAGQKEAGGDSLAKRSGSFRGTIIRLSSAAGVFAAAMLALPEGIWQNLGYIAAYVTAGILVMISAFKNVSKRRPFDETLLMTVASLGAMALGDFAEGAAVMLLFELGELLQSVAVGKSRRSISALLAMKPDVVHVLRGGEAVPVDPGTVAVGETIVVRPYERIPLDSVVLSGESAVDNSALTGESRPVTAKPGDALMAGGVNGEGALTLAVSAVFADSAVSKIIRMTQEAAKQKSPREKFITRFARVYTPAVVLSAAAVAVVPPLLGLGAFREWVYTALTFLVISCPCALVISVPLAFFAGLGGTSRIGVLVRGSIGIEALAGTKTAAFDKTGTLTRGDFAVLECGACAPFTEEQLLAFCAQIESLSTHPIARSIIAAYGKPLSVGQVSEITEIKGRGVRARVNGKNIAAGNGALMADLGIDGLNGGDGTTVVHVAVDGAYAGWISLGDQRKEDAEAAIGALRKMGIRTVLLSGDIARTAEAVAREIGIGEVHAGLLPADKVRWIEQLKKETAGITVFVGDGINDAPVIAAADLGVSMGGVGSDAAIEASDAVIMTDEPSKLPLAIRASRKTTGIVVQNIVFALSVKGVMMILGLFGMTTMWLAILADVGTALIAVLNSVRALHVKKDLK